MSKITAVLIYGLGMLAGALAFGLIKAQASWYGWAGVIVINLLIVLVVQKRDERRADVRAQNRIALRHYVSLPLAASKPSRPTGRTIHTSGNRRK